MLIPKNWTKEYCGRLTSCGKCAMARLASKEAEMAKRYSPKVKFQVVLCF